MRGLQTDRYGGQWSTNKLFTLCFDGDSDRSITALGSEPRTARYCSKHQPNSSVILSRCLCPCCPRTTRALTAQSFTTLDRVQPPPRDMRCVLPTLLCNGYTSYICNVCGIFVLDRWLPLVAVS